MNKTINAKNRSFSAKEKAVSAKLRPLAVIFFISGVWDTVAGILYLTQIGAGKTLNNPATDRFYAIFLASFFFCFAYLQFMSAQNIHRYLFNVGCLIIGRFFYIAQLSLFVTLVPGFPVQISFTGIIDGSFIILYLIFSLGAGVKPAEIFLPSKYQ